MEQKAIRFTLSGAAACFRKPDVNEKVYFTYNNIHRVALLGLLGAILGLKGYRNHSLFGETAKEFPEFYELLQPLQVAIIPNALRGYFTKKVQYFNNSVGYASKETGGNLMIYEQWLENPSWTIYLLPGNLPEALWNQLLTCLIKQRCTYIPYLGKNDFPAVISEVSVCSLLPWAGGGELYIHSLFAGDLALIDDSETMDDSSPYIFSEYAPVALQPEHNFYIVTRLIYTNCAVRPLDKTLYCDASRVLYFL